MDKKKVLYITTNSDLGGITKYLIEFVKYLPKNITPYFLTSSKGYLTEELEALGVKKEQIFFVPMTNSLADVVLHTKALVKFLFIIKKIKPDLIHCNATTGSIIASIAGSLLKIPMVYTMHGCPFDSKVRSFKRKILALIFSLVYAAYKKIICVCDYDRDITAKKFPFYKNKLITIYNGISDADKEFIKDTYSLSKDELSWEELKKVPLKVVMVSRFCPQKDPYTLIAAVGRLVKEGLNIQLDLWGYGQDKNKVLEYIRKTDCPNICYKGEVSDVTPILKDYDIYALISNYEGLPIGIIEGMRAGLPVLVSDVGGNSELINENGLVVEKGSIDDCFNKMRFIWIKRYSLKPMGENSRKYYQSEFNAQKMVKDSVNIYEDVCKS